MKQKEIILKYGINPYQKPSRIYSETGQLPIEVLNGNPGYINFMDAINSWQLVKELKIALKLPAAASFKHVSPAGSGLGLPLDENLKKAYFVENMELSPLAAAYARARGADRISSFGDWIALSDKVDESTALLIKKEVSDGIIAPDYSVEALKILKEKRKGSFNIIKIDPDYEPDALDSRKMYGIVFEQHRNNLIPNTDLLHNIVTENKNLPDEAVRDLIVSMITLKYTQSNSVCYALNGQVIGCGAGQQSRIHCTRLAGEKADLWFLRQHPAVVNLPFKGGVSRTEKDISIDQFLGNNTTAEEMKGWGDVFVNIPKRLTQEEKNDWLKNLDGVSFGSDAFFPQRDNIDRAQKSGVKYIVQPGGSIRDYKVINACNEYGMVMAFSNTRLFHH
ncbi:phosphoribosylaminoimidazolecarboxamide formyltransferase [Paenibacillus sp. URB8-2]|uniref:phosphoribosylaminoimidazolecarboxamide formyltransferase n=1 Tax=Paenibacillus sp. URB8-2 TaxID=2741301 RepID=UPI0015B80A2D|nr:phosphoribosylaminoimidazolecarboxamide formyltransferase [Paenibacillus sp. URB8-2]BCG58779.1 5-aminoimidazole-4-carboxamide ribonucleotide transformylase [Paenibacillus sp. URB8-2]